MKKKVDLGKYDLSQLLRNPGLVHSIQDALIAIPDLGFLSNTIKEGAKSNIEECIKMIVSQYGDNPQMITRIVGKKTLEMIEEFTGKTLADDLKNIL